MHPRLAALFILAGALVAPVGLDAQVAGLPVRNAGITRGLTLAAEAGFPNAASGMGTSYGASGAVGLGRLGLGATLARLDFDGQDPVLAGGATLNLRLIGGPLVPFSATLQAGVGAWSATVVTDVGGGSAQFDAAYLTIPVGLGMAWTIATPVVSLKPWLAPRVHVSRQTLAGVPGSRRRTDGALSGGIDLAFINGIALRGAYDRIIADGTDASVWSVGLGYSLRILR